MMGSSRGSRAPLAVDESVWASEAEGEEEVLAAFADEGALDAGATPPLAPPPDRSELPHRGLRVLSPQTPMRDVVRTVLIGCLSAMALGASFAIGFGYVWSDRLGNETPETVAITDAQPTVVADSPTAAPAAVEEPPAAKAATEPIVDATPVDPGPAFGVPLQAARDDDAPLADAPAVVDSLDVEAEALASQPMLAAESAAIPESVSPASPSVTSASVEEDSEPLPSRSLVAPKSDLDAVRQAIGRYQSAYAEKDVGAMALVWPSLDVAGVARAFENVDRQALTFNECRVTTAGKFATAVCPGLVRYVGRVGSRQLQERHGTWTIALERNGDAWQFTKLNVR